MSHHRLSLRLRPFFHQNQTNFKNKEINQNTGPVGTYGFFRICKETIDLTFIMRFSSYTSVSDASRLMTRGQGKVVSGNISIATILLIHCRDYDLDA